MTDERTHVEDWLVHIGFDRLAYAMNRGYNPQGVDRTSAAGAKFQRFQTGGDT